MTTKVEQDRSGSAFFLTTQSFNNRTFHRVIGLGSRHNAFSTCECDASIKAISLRIGGRVDLAKIDQLTHKRRHSVIPESTSMRRGR